MSNVRKVGGSRRKIGGSRRKSGAGTTKHQKRKTARRAYMHGGSRRRR